MNLNHIELKLEKDGQVSITTDGATAWCMLQAYAEALYTRAGKMLRDPRITKDARTIAAGAQEVEDAAEHASAWCCMGKEAKGGNSE